MRETLFCIEMFSYGGLSLLFPFCDTGHLLTWSSCYPHLDRAFSTRADIRCHSSHVLSSIIAINGAGKENDMLSGTEKKHWPKVKNVFQVMKLKGWASHCYGLSASGEKKKIFLDLMLFLFSFFAVCIHSLALCLHL